jgi:hypothetical protein
MTELLKIEGVEIFRAGKWNGDTYSREDLDAMVDAFGKVGWRVPLKIGHDDKPGAPAYGWLSRVYRKGEKLLADVVDVTRDVYLAIKNRHFDTCSAEIFFDIERNGKKFKRALKAVAILGAELPGVSGLRPLREVVFASAWAASQAARSRAYQLARDRLRIEFEAAEKFQLERERARNRESVVEDFGMQRAGEAVEAAIREFRQENLGVDYLTAYRHVLTTQPGLRREYGESGTPSSYLERSPNQRSYTAAQQHLAGETLDALARVELVEGRARDYREALHAVMQKNPAIKRKYAGI